MAATKGQPWNFNQHYNGPNKIPVLSRGKTSVIKILEASRVGLLPNCLASMHSWLMLEGVSERKSIVRQVAAMLKKK